MTFPGQKTKRVGRPRMKRKIGIISMLPKIALHRPLPLTLAAMFLVLLFLLLDLVQATNSIPNESESPRIYRRNAACRLIPGDAAWPKGAAWSQLNKTVNGRLIATVPVASICHDPKYEANTCGRLKKEWSFPQSQYVKQYMIRLRTMTDENGTIAWKFRRKY